MSATTDSPPDTTGSNSVVDCTAIDLYNLLDAASRHAVLTALCWRSLKRWESRLALEGRGDEAFNAQSVTVAREALVLLGSADPATRASATGYRPALAAGAAAAEPAPAAAVLDAIGALATVPGDQASERAVLDRALAALGTDAGDALAAAVAQQKAAREGTPRVRPLVEIGLVVLHLLAFFLVLAFAITQAGPHGGRPALPIILAVAVLMGPAVIVATRRPFRRERFLTFVVGGVLCAYLVESQMAWAITLGLAWLLGM